MAEQLTTGGGEFDPCRYRLRLRDCLLGAQMLFVAFGALVLVPLLTGLNSNVALFTAGVGTLLFQLVTLPVEFDASRRGLTYLKASGMNGAELAGASNVLRACALTYVAAALTSLLQLIYMVLSTRSED